MKITQKLTVTMSRDELKMLDWAMLRIGIPLGCHDGTAATWDAMRSEIEKALR